MAPSRSQKFYTKWSSDEINEIINWFAEADEQGNFPHVNQFIKGGTIAACREILRATSLGSKEAITVEKLRDKINNLSKQYKAARDWLSNTGEGLQDDGVDEDTIKGLRPTKRPRNNSPDVERSSLSKKITVVKNWLPETGREYFAARYCEDEVYSGVADVKKSMMGVGEAIVEAEKVRVEAQEKQWEKEEKQWEREEKRGDQEHEEKMELLR
ncbi:MAG: hypothetical protein M1816_006708 [Peltula sp. TS41687]|nr:MAG: hypothetical protein M1816_006708 [Peltula sp. TS41687]